MMALEFADHGVAYELVTSRGAEHGLEGGDLANAFDHALAWVNRYMR